LLNGESITPETNDGRPGGKLGAQNSHGGNATGRHFHELGEELYSQTAIHQNIRGNKAYAEAMSFKPGVGRGDAPGLRRKGSTSKQGEMGYIGG